MTPAQLRASTTEYFRARHPSATPSQLKLLVDDYHMRVGPNDADWADRNSNGIGHAQRDAWAREVEAAAAFAMAVIPSVTDLVAHIANVQSRTHSRSFSDIERHKLTRNLEAMEPDALLAEAQKHGFAFKARTVATDPPKKAPDTPVQTVEADTKPQAPTKRKTFAQMDPFERRADIAKRFGRDEASLLTSDVIRFSKEILRHEAQGVNAGKPQAVPSNTVSPVPNGMTREAFDALPPQERIRRARRDRAEARRDGITRRPARVPEVRRLGKLELRGCQASAATHLDRGAVHSLVSVRVTHDRGRDSLAVRKCC